MSNICTESSHIELSNGTLGQSFTKMIKEQIRNEHKLPDISYDTWIEPLKIYIGTPKRIIQIVLPSDISKDFVEKRFGQTIQDIFTDLLNEDVELIFESPGSPRSIAN